MFNKIKIRFKNIYKQIDIYMCLFHHEIMFIITCLIYIYIFIFNSYNIFNEIYNKHIIYKIYLIHSININYFYMLDLNSLYI